MQTEGVEVSVVQFESREQGGEPSLREMEEGNWCIHDYSSACTVAYVSYVSILQWEKLSREKTFCEFCGFVAICKSFLCEIWGHGILWHGTSEQSVKVFSTKSYFSPICKSFLPQKFPAIQQLMIMKGQEGRNAQSEGHTLAPHGCSFVQGVKFSVQTVSRGRAAYRSKEEDRLPRGWKPFVTSKT